MCDINSILCRKWEDLLLFSRNITSSLFKKPVWSNQCTHCMACIGNCPEEAIEYGTITQEKRPYNFDKYRYVIENLKK